MIILSDRILGVVYRTKTEHYEDGEELLVRNGIPCVHIHDCDFR